MRPFLTLWGLQEEKCVYWKVSVGLKCVRMSRIPWLWNISPLLTVVSRKLTFLSDISAVNLIEGWCLFARAMNNSSISFLSVLHNEKNIVNLSFPLKRFSFAGVRYFCLDRRQKDVGKGNCHLCTHCSSVCLEFLPLNSNKFFWRISLRILLRDWVGIGVFSP